MQTAKESRRSASGRPSPHTSPQCDTNCLCQRQPTMSLPKRRCSPLFLVERTGWNRQSSRSRCTFGLLDQPLIDTVSTIESLSDIRKQSPTLPFPLFNTIDKQRRHLAQASSPRIRRRTYSSRRPTAPLSPRRRAFAWPERRPVPGKADTIGKRRSCPA